MEQISSEIVVKEHQKKKILCPSCGQRTTILFKIVTPHNDGTNNVCCGQEKILEANSEVQ